MYQPATTFLGNGCDDRQVAALLSSTGRLISACHHADEHILSRTGVHRPASVSPRNKGWEFVVLAEQHSRARTETVLRDVAHAASPATAELLVASWMDRLEALARWRRPWVHGSVGPGTVLVDGGGKAASLKAAGTSGYGCALVDFDVAEWEPLLERGYLQSELRRMLWDGYADNSITVTSADVELFYSLRHAAWLRQLDSKDVVKGNFPGGPLSYWLGQVLGSSPTVGGPPAKPV